MKEEMEEQTHMLQESFDFQVKERSFYEVLGQKYPHSPLQDNNYHSSNGSRHPIDLNTPTDNFVYFRKGVDDASKFLPSGSKLLGINDALVQNPKEGEIKEGKVRQTGENACGEERSKKLPAVYTESNNVPKEEFDDVLLYAVGECDKKFEARRTYMQNARSKSMQHSGLAKGYNGAMGRRSKKMEVIDLRSLLISCAKSIAADDRLAADEFLKQIRQHSSPFGDGSQRLAHYFADGLEARLAGTGSQIHKSLVYKLTITSDYLRAYHTFLASSPFGTISIFVANKLIAIKSEKAMRVHVIDFGIHYGFQWPTFIQSLAEREGGPPKLRITGIDFPQAGFRPAERIEETGCRLAHYAETFNVPFEYNAIAQRWETIKIEDLKIEEGEFVAVNCLYRAQNIRDEIGLEESSRTMVLNLIRKINPDIFIHGIVNGAYGVPFFLTRFREALFCFSAVYDMLETNIPRESPERMLIETGIFGKEALNVIACEGWERVERPETYKQWRLRHLRSGFVQVPFERELMDSAMYKVRKFYHREFVIDEDNNWLLMGWKGRTIYAMSCWQPV
ncbi:scarecrow-like protein 9 [Phtheirospermum japonicum]|uniref:Scarecrow-like protein 9 n=1 Tax=Phtheirospermum japonicum TaxID=374723 RepID=A0A830C623_9LAMI|nr:scarecrow-like protein 9 [Phtheirospermum japonicum]